MRIALVTPFTQRAGLSHGGVESVAECLATSLVGLGGLELDVLAPSFDGRSDVERRDFGTVHWLPHAKPAFLSYWSVFRRRVHERLRDLCPQVAHFQGYAGWALGYRQPCVITIHGIPELDTRFSGKSGSQLRSLVIARVESLARARADAKIVINPYVSTALSGRLGGSHWSIENPVHPEFFTLTRDPTRERLLYVGRISARKNIESLLRAFASLVHSAPAATLRLAGNADDPGFLARCKMLCDELSIGDRVTWLGNLPRDLLLEEFRHTAALALVSYQETAPMVIAEAMAAAIPVVASRVCGNPHLVIDGQTGWLVDPGDVDDIARGLRSALNEAAARALGNRARQEAMLRFEPERVAARTHEVYERVIAAAAARAA